MYIKSVSSEFNHIFYDNCNYNTLNKFCKKRLRNMLDGISLDAVIYYDLAYCYTNTTKESITANINTSIRKKFTRQAFEAKSKNISINFYKYILSELILLYNSYSSTDKIIAIDGTYTNNNLHEEVLNLGFYDITNNIPIDIKTFGNKNKNNEISSTIKYIKSHIDSFNKDKVIFVADRGYFSYNFIKFLIDNKFKFVLRGRMECTNIDNTKPLKKNTPNYSVISEIRQYVHVVRCKYEHNKILTAGKNKKNSKTLNLLLTSECNLVTNLDKTVYMDSDIIDIYRKRWDIEVYFKYLKYNFKTQNINDKVIDKLFVCQLIITYLEKILESYYVTKNKDILKSKDCYYKKINKSLMADGIINFLIKKLLSRTINNVTLDEFLNKYTKIITNKKERSYPRNSKTPYSKWYIKGYSEITKFDKILKAILTNDYSKLNKKLNKNLKRLIKNIRVT